MERMQRTVMVIALALPAPVATVAGLASLGVISDALQVLSIIGSVVGLGGLVLLLVLASQHLRLRWAARSLGVTWQAWPEPTNSETRRSSLREPRLFVAVLQAADEAAVTMDDAVGELFPAFVGLDFERRAADDLVPLARELVWSMWHPKELGFAECRRLASEVASALAAHDPSAVLAYVQALGPSVALEALDAGLPLDYAREMYLAPGSA